MEVTAKDIRGNTALHYAAANGLRRCVEYLVAHGAEVFLDNYDGLTVSFCSFVLTVPSYFFFEERFSKSKQTQNFCF